MLRAPIGNWVWIWDLAACEGGDLDAIIAVCQRCNVHGVAIKAFDGEWRWPRQWSKAIVDRLHAAGISVAGWCYTVGNWEGQADGVGGDVHHCTTEKEIENVAWALAAGPDFFIIDPEKEWCVQGDDLAREWGRQYRARFGDFPVYAGSVPSEGGYWVGNPLRAMAEWVDGFCPQVYTWSWDVDVATWTDKSIRLGYGKPVYPIYESSSNAPAEYMTAAARYAKAQGCAGVSWWSWQHATDAEWVGIQAAGALLGDVVAAALVAPPAPAPVSVVPADQAVDNANAWHDPAIGPHWVIPPLLGKWRAEGIARCGYPVGGMVPGASGGVEQVFERVLLTDGEGDPGPFGTLGRRYLDGLAQVAADQEPDKAA